MGSGVAYLLTLCQLSMVRGLIVPGKRGKRLGLFGLVMTDNLGKRFGLVKSDEPLRLQGRKATVQSIHVWLLIKYLVTT